MNLNKPFNEACLGFGLVKKFETKARLCVGVCCVVKISHACFSPHLSSHNSTAQQARKLQVLLSGPVYKKVVRVVGMENGFSRFYESYHFLWESTFLANLFLFPPIQSLCFYCSDPVYLRVWHYISVKRLFMYSLNCS